MPLPDRQGEEPERTRKTDESRAPSADEEDAASAADAPTRASNLGEQRGQLERGADVDERVVHGDGACRPAAGNTRLYRGRSRFQVTVTFAGMKVMARSASAAIVSDGLTPGLADTDEPSIT